MNVTSGGGTVKSGTVNLTNSGTEQIVTGLSSITRFVIFGAETSAPYPPGVNVSWWMSDYSTRTGSHYSDAYGGGRGFGPGQRALTDNPGSYGIMVSDVTGGTVTVKCAVNDVTGTYYWYAE